MSKNYKWLDQSYVSFKFKKKTLKFLHKEIHYKNYFKKWFAKELRETNDYQT